MTDEEKKAIVELKHYSSMTAYWKQEEYTNTEIDNYIKIILNLIEKQYKEIEDLNKKPIFLIKDLYNRKLKEISLQDVERLIEQGREEMKAKIKSKIEEVQNMKAKAKDIVFKSSLNYIETELQSLLERGE